MTSCQVRGLVVLLVGGKVVFRSQLGGSRIQSLVELEVGWQGWGTERKDGIGWMREVKTGIKDRSGTRCSESVWCEAGSKGVWHDRRLIGSR